MTPVTTFHNHTLAVFGLGASGIAAAKALIAGGANVAAWDDSEASRTNAAAQDIPLVDLRTSNWGKYSALVLAPGVPLTHPQPHWVVGLAKAARVRIIGDVELFCRERHKLHRNAPFIAVTGTNGKSTTTALIAHILRADGRDVQVGGNIGTPILSLDPPAASRFHVIEMSSFQLELTPTLRPTVGVLLNVAPDHLDRHGNMVNYFRIKERLMLVSDEVCIGLDDEWCLALAARLQTRRIVQTFSTNPELKEGYHAVGAKLCFDSELAGFHEEIADLTGIRSLRGEHNAQNALAAICTLSALRNAFALAARSRWFKPDISLSRRWFENDEEFSRRFAKRFTDKFFRKKLPPSLAEAARRKEALQEAIASFPGLPHRLEEIGRLGGVLLINDSKATNADSTAKALASFPSDIFWIVGGKAKEGGIASLESYFPRIAKAYLIGESTEPFAATLEGKVAFERCGTLDAALAAAMKDAKASAGSEPVVLLSPACASYDQFKNFEVRGDAFRKLVAELPGVEMRERGTV